MGERRLWAVERRKRQQHETRRVARHAHAHVMVTTSNDRRDEISRSIAQYTSSIHSTPPPTSQNLIRLDLLICNVFAISVGAKFDVEPPMVAFSTTCFDTFERCIRPVRAISYDTGSAEAMYDGRFVFVALYSVWRTRFSNALSFASFSWMRIAVREVEVSHRYVSDLNEAKEEDAQGCFSTTVSSS